MDATGVIGVVGGGIGGLATAIALRQMGADVVVFEQAPAFGRVGADINLTPNAVKALDGLGVGAALRETAAMPTHRISRTWDTGTETSRLAMSTTAEERYGSPQLTMHRADLMTALENALPTEVIRLGHRIAAIEARSDGVTVRTDTGVSHDVEVLVGADGIHSTVRTALFGHEHPEFTGVVAYRAVVPVDRLRGVANLDAFTKWWGPNPESQIVTFPLNRGRDMFVFATTPQASWREESWTTPGSVVELREVYQGFHADARAMLAGCDSVLKSALYVRAPLPRWSVDNVTLLGDACHPMTPFMAQGAGMAIEDAVVLGRALTEKAADEPSARLTAYESARLPRTSRVQISSRGNEWLKDSGNGDWVYGYDAWTVVI